MPTETKTLYSAIVLGATGNVGGRIAQVLIKNPRCEKVVVVTRRNMDAFADPKVSEVVVNMDRLEEEIAPHAQGVDVALAAFGVGKGSAKMPEEEVRKTPTRNTTLQDNSSERYPMIYIDTFVSPPRVGPC